MFRCFHIQGHCTGWLYFCHHILWDDDANARAYGAIYINLCDLWIRPIIIYACQTKIIHAKTFEGDWMVLIQLEINLFYQHDLTFIPGWISNNMRSEVWDEITYLYLNFSDATVEVREWKSNFMQHFKMDVTTYTSKNKSVSWIPLDFMFVSWDMFIYLSFNILRG